MAINKVVYDENTLIDLTNDTVTPETMLSGVTAHDKSGNVIVGTFEESGGGNQLPALTNPGAATDMAEGKELIDGNGNVITGGVPVYDADNTANSYTGFLLNTNSDAIEFKNIVGTFLIIGKFKQHENVLLRSGARVSISTETSQFGDAMASDVTEGKTFTSSAGFKKVGTRTDSGLPSGISKLATGTYTPTADSTANFNISHGLGVAPNFMIIAPEGAASSSDAGYLHSQFVIYRYSKSNSKTLYGYGIMNYTNTSGEVSCYIREETSSPGTRSITVRQGSGYRLKGGVTYRWVCGVMDGIQ